MIMAISGRIGAGKDTVGKIIQHLTSEWADEEFQDTDMLDVRSNWKIKKFAGKLKQIGSILTGVPVEIFEDQEFKKQEMPEEWWYKNVYDAGWDKKWTKETINYPTHTSTESHIVKTTYRQFLQNLGTEAMRDGLHTNVWVNALFSDYKDIIEERASDDLVWVNKPNWIITDMRFPNELEAVKDRGGITIRVNRNNQEDICNSCGHKRSNHNYRHPFIKQTFGIEHESETALDNAEFDYTIDNNGTIEDFIEKVRELLIKLKII